MSARFRYPGFICAGLIGLHAVLAFGICNLTFWLYFDAGIRWTPDPVTPQIQGSLALIGQVIAALILVPSATLPRWRGKTSLLIAAVWPIVLGGLPFLMPHVLGWLALAVLLLVVGLVMVLSMTLDQLA